MLSCAKHMIPATKRLGFAVAVLLSSVLACSVTPVAEGLRPFTTDGCSRFPDREPIGEGDWCHCCVIHDLAYWRGGTFDERMAADLALKDCVYKASDSKALAEAMFAGVRIGGGPKFDTPYRWGYGWPAGRPYKPLTPEEDASAESLRQEYTRTNPQLSCKK